MLFVSPKLAVLLLFFGSHATAAGIRNGLSVLDTDTDSLSNGNKIEERLLKPEDADKFTDFKTKNLLHDDFARPAQLVSKGRSGSSKQDDKAGSESITFGGNSNGSLRSARSSSSTTTTISLSSDDWVPMPSIFSSAHTPAHYYLNGVLQAELPDANVTRNGLFVSQTDPAVTIVTDREGTFQKALRHDPTTGRSSALLPLDLELGVFAEVVRTLGVMFVVLAACDECMHV